MKPISLFPRIIQVSHKTLWTNMKFTRFFVLLILSILSVFNLNANDLKNHSAPYLALHGDDPVNWMEWGEPAIEKARKENKLLFVSIGYFACHWCHVMQRESYADKGIAQKLNKNYISIKVDRELNPVLDKRLIEFVQITNGTAGWPLNVFLTPEGFPLVGATYMPREHFSGVLDQLDNKWSIEQTKLKAQAKDMNKTLNAMLQKQEKPSKGKTMQQLIKSFVPSALQYADKMQGGFGQQRKFPQIPQMLALLKLNSTINKDSEVDEFIKLTLDQMARQGLHDELGGGFYRYTTDPDWETPHFEKMLYTNAMMPLLYFNAFEQYGDESYKKTALETISFLSDSMRGTGNAFIASLSAVDDKGEEGGFYLWTKETLKQILSKEELTLANEYWNLNRANELPAGNLPRQVLTLNELAKKLKKTENETGLALARIKQKLKQYRKKNRSLPRDTKLLAGMNGLTLSAFAKGLKYDPNFKTTGQNLANFLLSLWNGKTLRRSAANAKSGTLYDYAAVSLGLIEWGAASNNVQAKQTGLAIAKTAWSKFYKDKSWIENPDSLLPQGVQQAHITDSSLISAEALLLKASILSNDKLLLVKVQTVMSLITRSLETDVYSHASFLSIN